MFFLLHFIFILYAYGETLAGDEMGLTNLTLNEISSSLFTILNTDTENTRIKELKEKLETVNKYVISNDVIAEALNNVTNTTELNATHFYESLNEYDPLKDYLLKNDSKHLYLKLKERMTRDDIINILAEKSQEKKLKNAARRMMQDEIPNKDDDERFNEVVDEFIAELPNDNHKAVAENNIDWDPQPELEALKERHDNVQSGRRLFLGERTIIKQYPFMVSIHVMGRFWCGGAIYWNDIVLTSASCLQLMHNNRFFRENPRALQVRVNSNHSRIGGELVDVLEVYFHPGYSPRTLRDNLAVIRLRRQLVLTHRKYPKLIRISHLDHNIPSTADIQVLGWGVTKFSQKLSFEPIFLQKKTLPVYPKAFCKEVYGDKFITDKMFCAGTLTTGEGACDHDAGGPAILSGKLVGIISFGPSVCGFPDAPTVFTLVGAYADWIETVNASMPAYYRERYRTTTTKKSTLDEYFSTWRIGSMRPDSGFRPVRINEFPIETPFDTTIEPVEP